MAKLKIAKELFDLFFPVGYIYTSMNSTDPKTLFGYGEWTQITDKFLYCTNSSKSTGGNSLKYSPGSHQHRFRIGYLSYYGTPVAFSGDEVLTAHDSSSYSSSDEPGGSWYERPEKYKDSWTTAYGNKGLQAGGTNFSNVAQWYVTGYTENESLPDYTPPYITCYAWYRTA